MNCIVCLPSETEFFYLKKKKPNGLSPLMSSGYVQQPIDLDEIRIRFKITFRLRSGRSSIRTKNSEPSISWRRIPTYVGAHPTSHGKAHSIKTNCSISVGLAQRTVAIALQCDITTTIWTVESPAGEPNTDSSGRPLQNALLAYDQQSSRRALSNISCAFMKDDHNLM